jgi:hypothetical protein
MQLFTGGKENNVKIHLQEQVGVRMEPEISWLRISFHCVETLEYY